MADATQEDQSAAYVADETEFNVFNTDRKLSAVESVGKMFASLPEKKFLVHFSSGIQQTGTENQSQLRATIDTLNQNNTSLYAVDARGLIAAPPGGDASQGSASGNANYSGRAFRNQMALIADAQETLTTLALDTGGRTLQDRNDLGQVFESVREDSNSYYLLGYYSSSAKRDGKFRNIKVQVSLPGVRIRHRPGYYAAKSFQQFTKADKERQLEEAVTTERPFSEVPFLIAANFVKSGSQQVFVPIGLQFSARDIPLEGSGKKGGAEFDFIGQIRNAENRVVSAVRDTVRVQPGPGNALGQRAREIQYTTGFYLKPGQYQMKFLLRENQTGKLSTFEQHLPVPNFTEKKLSMSSIILSNRLEPANEKNKTVTTIAGFQTSAQDPDPLRLDDNRVVPSVSRVFSRQDTLYIFFQTYLPGRNKGAPSLTQSLLFFRDDELFREAASLQISQFDEDSHDTATSNFSIPLIAFPKGQYVLQVNTVEPTSQESLIQRVNFVVR